MTAMDVARGGIRVRLRGGEERAYESAYALRLIEQGLARAAGDMDAPIAHAAAGKEPGDEGLTVTPDGDLPGAADENSDARTGFADTDEQLSVAAEEGADSREGLRAASGKGLDAREGLAAAADGSLSGAAGKGLNAREGLRAASGMGAEDAKEAAPRRKTGARGRARKQGAG